LILDVLKNIIDLKLNCRYHKWAFSHDQRKALYYCTWKFIWLCRNYAPRYGMLIIYILHYLLY